MELSDAEVPNPGFARGRLEDVRRLHVTVDDSPFVHVRQGVGQSRAESGRLWSAERSLVERLGERRAVYELHDQVRVVTGESGVQQSDESRVFETLKGPSLLRQAPNEFGIARAHDLQRHGGAASFVERFIDIGHAASTE